jgi:hypothetical protein
VTDHVPHPYKTTGKGVLIWERNSNELTPRNYSGFGRFNISQNIGLEFCFKIENIYEYKPNVYDKLEGEEYHSNKPLIITAAT